MGKYTTHLSNLPVNPGIAAKILTLAGREDFSYGAIEELIGRDPGLAARILKIANSALYARQGKVTRLQNAITLLGINTIKNLVILVTGSSLFSRNLSSRFYALFWRHSLASAYLARELAPAAGFPDRAEEAFVAGLLHNIGEVALFLNEPADYEALIARARREGRRLAELELEAYGTDHKLAGHEILTEWSFPELYRDAALEHGNRVVNSRHKPVILCVTVAETISANWTFLAGEPAPLQGLGPHLAWMGMDAAGLEAWQEGQRLRLESDPSFAEFLKLA